MNQALIFWFACSGILLCYASEHNKLVKHKKIGIFSDINKRDNQEDFFYHGIVDGGNLYAMYDGHGGHEIAQFLAEKFPDYLSKTLGSMEERFKATFKNIDNDEFVKLHKQCGSTASVVFIKDNIAHFAHVGDSRMLLEEDGKIDFVTSDHKPNRADEYIRIEDNNGLIFNKRVNGFLAVSRAFGDYGLDKRLIIAEPEYRELSLTKKNRFLVLATDGLWDMVASEEVVGILCAKQSRVNDMNLLAKLLAGFAITRGSHDNITVMLVDLLS